MKAAGLVLAISLLGNTFAHAAEVKLAEGRIAPATWATVEITSLQAGDAVLDGGAGRTLWPHPGGRISVRVLVPPDVGPVWTINLNGQRFDLPVEVEPATYTANPRLSVVMPRAYDGVTAWQQARPAGERAWIVVAALVGAMGIVAVMRVRIQQRYRLSSIALVSTLLIVAFVSWREARSALAIRMTSIELVDAAGVDRWWFVTAPDRSAPAPVVVAFDGETLPVAFSPQHLRQLAPQLHCDSQGIPLHFEVTLPPASIVAIVQRRNNGAVPVDIAPWAKPLLRNVYSRR